MNNDVEKVKSLIVCALCYYVDSEEFKNCEDKREIVEAFNTILSNGLVIYDMLRGKKDGN